MCEKILAEWGSWGDINIFSGFDGSSETLKQRALNRARDKFVIIFLP